MGIGLDEVLMIAINLEVDHLHGRPAAVSDIGQLAERLHRTYPHRTVEQINNRLKLVLYMRGQLSSEALRDTTPPVPAPAGIATPAAERLRSNPPLHANP